MVLAMGAVGVGGWLATRGGYRGTRAPRASVAAPPAPARPPPPSHAVTPPTPGPALTPAQSASQPSLAPPAEPKPAARVAKKPSARGARAGAKRDADSRKATLAPLPPRENAVLKLTPHQDSAELPDIPGRDDVLAALAPIRAAVAQCARGMHGVAQLDITVANTGFVTHAVVGGDFAGTPEGSCIARAARAAQFVSFKKPRFRVIYPFSL